MFGVSLEFGVWNLEFIIIRLATDHASCFLIDALAKGGFSDQSYGLKTCLCSLLLAPCHLRPRPTLTGGPQRSPRHLSPQSRRRYNRPNPLRGSQRNRDAKRRWRLLVPDHRTARAGYLRLFLSG